MRVPAGHERRGEQRERFVLHAVDVAAMRSSAADALVARLEPVAALPGRVAPALRDAVVAQRRRRASRTRRR